MAKVIGIYKKIAKYPHTQWETFSLCHPRHSDAPQSDGDLISNGSEVRWVAQECWALDIYMWEQKPWIDKAITTKNRHTGICRLLCSQKVALRRHSSVCLLLLLLFFFPLSLGLLTPTACLLLWRVGQHLCGVAGGFDRESKKISLGLNVRSCSWILQH